jgi:F0F1-type ATP synthase membrane subunit b/b'
MGVSDIAIYGLGSVAIFGVISAVLQKVVSMDITSAKKRRIKKIAAERWKIDKKLKDAFDSLAAAENLSEEAKKEYIEASNKIVEDVRRTEEMMKGGTIEEINNDIDSKWKKI